ncbi:MAG: PAS domain S-box protein [Ardenticatenaceae bacterium]
MKKARIIVVEDEVIIAMEIEERLASLGYDVLATLSSGEEAIVKVAQMQPDLVLMDIMLRGEINGMTAASHIRARFDIPIVYLTAYGDENTLRQAKVTEPFGYILKPFEERDLKVAIEIALYKHRMEQQLKENQQRLVTTLNSIGEGVVAIDPNGCITFMNAVAESLAGWQEADALGKGLTEVFQIVNGKKGSASCGGIQHSLKKVLSKGELITLDNHYSLIAPDGTSRALDGNVAPIMAPYGTNGNNENQNQNDVVGAVLALRDVTARKESAIRHRLLLEASPDPVVFYDLEGRATYLNAAFTQTFGWQALELLGKRIDFVPEENWPETNEKIRIIFEEQAVYKFETRRFTKNGRILDVDINAALVHDHDDNATGMVVQFRDITPRKQAERAERESKRQVSELRVAAEISEQINAILEPDQLLRRTIELLKARFDLYHVHIYQKIGKELVMQLGSGEVGEFLRQRAHAIPFDHAESIVARAARHQQAILVNDTGTTSFLANPLLPDTRSEVAVPLMVGGRVLGVLDLQHNQPNRFTEADVDLFSTLARQVATALENARLFEEQKRSEQALRASEERFRAAFFDAPTGMALVDTDGSFMQTNRAFRQLLGYTEEELPALTYLDLTHPDDAEKSQRLVGQLLLGELSAFQSEKRYVHKSGHEVWAQVSVSLVRDSNGSYIMAQLQDLTEKKIAEHALEEQRAFLRQVIDLNPQFVFAKDRDGRFTLVNQALAEAYGSTVEQLLGKNDADFNSNMEEVEHFRRQDLAVLDSGQEKFIPFEQITDAVGQVRWLQTIKRPIYSNGVATQVLGVATDITPRIEAEQRLRESEARQRAILEATPDPIFRFSRDGTYLDIEAINTRLPKLIKQGEAFDRTKLVGQNLRDVAPPKVRQTVMSAILEALSSGVMQTVEYELPTEEGIRIYEARVVASQPDNHHNNEALAVVRDITDRKQAELQLSRLATGLRTAADMAEQLTSILEPERLLAEVVLQLKERFNLYHVQIYLLDKIGRYLMMRAGSGEVGAQLRKEHHQIRFDAERSLVARAARDAQTIVVNDVRTTPDFLPNPLLPDTCSEVAIPLIVRGQVMGVLGVQDDQPHRFNQADLDSLNTLAGQIATSLSNAYFFEKVEQSLDESNIKLAVNQALAAAESEEEVLITLIEQAQVVYPEVEVAIIARNQTHHEVVARSTGMPLAIGWGATTNEWPVVQDLMTLQVIASADTFLGELEPEVSHSSLEAELSLSSVLLPIASAEEWIGTLLCATPIYDFFQERVVRLYQILAEQGAIALRAARLRAATEQARAEVERERALLDGILQNLPAGVMVVDQHFQLLRTNAVAQELLGRPVMTQKEKEYVEQYDMIRTVNGQRYTESDLPLVKTMRTGERHSVSDIAVRKPDGSLVHLLANSGPLFKNGQLAGAMLSFADISERVRAEEEVARFAAQLRTAAELAEQINGIHELDQLLEEVVSQLQHRFNLYHVHIYLLDRYHLVMHRGSGDVGRLLQGRGHAIPLNANSLVARAAREQQVITVNDVLAEPTFMPNELLPDTRSEIAVPLIAGERVLGVLDLQHNAPHRFGPQIDVLRTLGGQIATALQNARLFEQLEQALEEARLRVRVNQELAVTRTEEEVLQTIMALASIYREAQITLSLNDLDAEEPHVVIYDSRSLDSRVEVLPKGSKLLLKDVPLIEYISDKPFFVTDNLFTDERVDEGVRQIARHTGGVSFTVVPLIIGQNWLASLTASSKKEGYFDKHKMQLFKAIADRGAIALREARLFEQVQRNYEQTRIGFEVSQALAAAQTEEEVLDVVIEQLGVFSDIAASIFTIDQEAEKQSFIVTVRRSSSFDEPLASRGVILPAGTPLTDLDAPAAEAFLELGTISANDMGISASLRLISNVEQEETLTSLTRDFLMASGIQSSLTLPMVAGNKLLGFVHLLSQKNGFFDEAHTMDVYHSLVEQGAVALRSAQLFDETIRIAERLREVDRLKSEFLANMSHELRTPLNSIIGYSEIMLMGINGPLNDETMEDVQAIRNSGRHLLSLINDILDLAKIEAGRMALDLDEISLESVFDDVYVSHMALLHEKPVELLIQIPEAMPCITGDRVRINQILTNLVSNAIKFTDRGTVTLRATHKADWIAIEVIDTGIGMKEEDIDQIFGQFRQVDGSSTRRAEGTGLGLAITMHLIEMHGGRIEVSSKLGQGSTFIVNLPVKPPEEEEV